MVKPNKREIDLVLIYINIILSSKARLQITGSAAAVEKFV